MTNQIGPRPVRDSSDPNVGAVLNGKFEILSRLAVGGMGQIYRARQVPLDREVAVKILHSQYTNDTPADTFQRRFSREATILSRLQHANIVTVYDFGLIEGRHPETYFMAMEYLQGRTLLERLVDMGTMTPSEVFAVIRQVARGLREAHKQGLVHRDLKPSNIMLIPDDGGEETVKILDFGLVKVLSDDSDQVTKEGNLLGSPRYMAPEQITHSPIDARTDIYALGVIMFQCLCGVVPYESDQAVQTLMAHLNEPIPRMKDRSPDANVPSAVEEIVRRCLSKEPGNRPASVGELVRVIAACERSLGLTPGPLLATDLDSGSMSRSRVLAERAQDSATVAEPSALRKQPAELVLAQPSPVLPSRSPWIAVAGGAGILVAGAALAVVLLRDPPQPAANQAVSSSAAPTSQFVMWIDSVPVGADVFDGETKVGTTPMQMSLDNAALRNQPRSLSLRMPGYQRYSIAQGPSGENVRVTAALIPDSAVAPAGSPSAAVAGAAPTSLPTPGRTGAAATKPPPARTDSDIRLNR